MIELFVKDAKFKSNDELLDIVAEQGFNIRSCIGFEWIGNDCKFTQPPTQEQVDSKRRQHRI